MTFTKAQIETIKSSLDAFDDGELEARHDAMLDDAYPDCKVAGYAYDTSEALKRLDPIAYRQSLLDFIDSECKDDILVEVDDEYYDADDVKDLIEELEN